MNPLLHHNLTIGLFADNPFLRGFVSGFGVIHLLIGLNDIIRMNHARRAGGG
jgi:hypothetical protein